MSEYKKFDLEAALRGEKVLLMAGDSCTWDVVELALLPNSQLLAAKFVGDGTLATFKTDGTRIGGFKGDRLVMAPKPKRKVKLWTNVYQRHDGAFECGAAYETKEHADAAAQFTHQFRKPVATVPIEEFEIGDNDK